MIPSGRTSAWGARPGRPRRQPLCVPAGRARSLATRRAPRQPAPGCPPAPPSRRRPAGPGSEPGRSPHRGGRSSPHSTAAPQPLHAPGAGGGHRKAAGRRWGWGARWLAARRRRYPGVLLCGLCPAGVRTPSAWLRLRGSAAPGSDDPDARGSGCSPGVCSPPAPLLPPGCARGRAPTQGHAEGRGSPLCRRSPYLS